MHGLTPEEWAALNSVHTPRPERQRLYGKRLRATADAYIVAADAPGLAKSAARYLFAEGMRLTSESAFAYELADVMDDLETAEAQS
jgi:hypothetical protein